MNIATLRVEGNESSLESLASLLPGRADQQWFKGDRRRSGGEFELSGFSIIVVEGENPHLLLSQLRAFLRQCRERGVVLPVDTSAALSIGVTVGEPQQFAASIDLSREDLKSLAQFGAPLSITAYPTSDEANASRAI